MSEAFVLGAVAYDAKVVTIWDGFQRWFASRGLPFDYVLFTNYERLVEAQFNNQVDVAWNSPLAWLESLRLGERCHRGVRAVAMRDTDQDLTSVILTRSAGGIHTVADLRGKRVGVGAEDSPQATILPLLYLAESGLEPRKDFDVVVHDVLAGKHGDHVGGERDAVKALLKGEVDAACMLDANSLTFVRDGTVHEGALRMVAETAPYDHCNFTVLDGAPERLVALFTDLLFGMRYDDPEVRALMDLEGLKEWRPGRTEGYEPLTRACDRFHTLDPWLARVTPRVGRYTPA